MGAFSNKDIQPIDELLHGNALFVYPNGQRVTKAMVLDNYRTGNSSFTSITSSDQVINVIDNTAIVTIVRELTGKYYGQEIRAQFRYI